MAINLLWRYVKHTFAWRPSYAKAFNAECIAAVKHAVAACEASNLSEICVIAELALPYSYLKRKQAVHDRALMLFAKHRVWDTEHRAGILLYTNFTEKRVEIIADRTAFKAIEQAQWNEWVHSLERHYANKLFQHGLLEVIAAMHTTFNSVLPKPKDFLQKHTNEVSNTPILL